MLLITYPEYHTTKFNIRVAGKKRIRIMEENKRQFSPEGCAELIRGSTSMVALTGAGISTAAGIPDFRGPSGLYATRRYDPELVFNIDHFRQDPSMFYEFTRDFAVMLKDIRPTFTHHFLSALEKKGILKCVITQNIDALHHFAGSRKVIELHGSYWSAACTRCDAYSIEGKPYEWWVEAIRNSPRSPIIVCPRCGGVVKPDVVFFGEMVHDFEKAADLVAGCDLLLVLGSSLEVYPAALLPQMTSANVLLVNKGQAKLSPAPNRFFAEADLDEYFSKVAEYLDLRISSARDREPIQRPE
jgi:NAD-dependent deacetylase